MVHVTLAVSGILKWLLDIRGFVHPYFRLCPTSKSYEQQKFQKFGLIPPSGKDKTKGNHPRFVQNNVTSYRRWDHEASKL